MIFYIGVFGILAILSFFEIFTNIGYFKKVLEYAVVLSGIFISSIRCGVAGDYEAYKLVFEQTNININVFKAITTLNTHNTEIVYNLLNYVVKYFGGNYQSLIFVEALLVNLMLYIFTKWFFKSNEIFHGKDYTISIYWLMWGFGLYNIVIVRQTISVMVCWLSIRFILKKKFKPFCLYVVVASLIHRASVLWIIAYFIFNINTNENENKRMKYVLKVIFIVIVGICGIDLFASFLPGMLGVKLRLYLNEGLKSYGESYSVTFLILKSLINVGVLAIVFIILYKYCNKNVKYAGFFNLYIIGAAIIIVSSFTSNELARAATPFSMLSVFMILYLFRIDGNLKTVLLYYNGVAAYTLLRLLVSINGSALSSGYKNIYNLWM